MTKPELKNRFFIIFPPGLEDIGKKEIECFFSKNIDPEFHIIQETLGGIELTCSLINGAVLNHVIKSASRILLRINDFKCRDFPKLYQKLLKENWHQYLLDDQVEIKSEGIESRIFDSRKIEKTAKDAIHEAFKRQPQKKKFLELAVTRKFLPKIYLRFYKDVCTIGIDLSGENLHFRGERLLTALAPIRETLAAGLIIDLLEGTDINNPITFYDPMCGSGTFLSEVLTLNKPNLTRNFAYQHLPLFINLKTSINEMLAQLTSLFLGPSSIYALGSDIDSEVIKKCRSNLSFLSKDSYHLTINDLFENAPIKADIIIINPPYGIRVKTDTPINDQYFQKIIEAIMAKSTPSRLGIIVPAPYKIKKSPGIKNLTSRQFKNGGIIVTFYKLECEPSPHANKE